MNTTEIYNYQKVNDSLITAGQPTAAQLQAAAEEGIDTVINLGMLDQSYSLEDEAGLVRSLGMSYHHIPVEWEGPTEENLKTFEELMNSLPPGRILLHCAANFRATAFYGLYGMRNLGWSEARLKELMSPIWQGNHYPVWEDFIRRMKKQEGSCC